MRQIVEIDPTRNVLLLAALGGFGEALDRASMRSLGDRLDFPLILVLCLIGGAIGGIIGMYIGGFLLQITGRWLGGVASSEQLRAALAYSSIPGIWGLLLWAAQLGLFGKDMFTEEMPTLEANPALLFALLPIVALELLVGIWGLVVCLKCVGEVHQFSAWRALGAVILAGLILVGIALCIAIPFLVLAMMA